jgi:uncharacterized membrane protein (DUF106 family)
VTVLNALLVRGADLVLTPLAVLPAPLGIALAALVTAVVILGLVRVTSDQAALATVKRQIQADLFEMRLFNDDLRALLRAQGAVLAHNGRYLRLSLLPLVFTAVPLALGIAQLQAWYGYSGLAPDVPVLVSADLTPGVEPTSPRLEGDGVRVDGEAMYFPSLRQLVWRVVPTASGAHQVVVEVNGVRYEKSLVVATGVARRSPVRPPANLIDQLLEPSEPPIPAGGPLAAIHLPYPDRSIGVLGVSMHWLVLYLVVSFAFVLLLRKPLGVVI